MLKRWLKGNLGRFWEDDYKKFTYNKKRAQGQIYDNNDSMPDWVKNFKKIFNLKNQTYTFLKMSPGDVIPAHSDHYQQFTNLSDAKYENMFRVIIVMLEDWKPGHYFEIDGQGIVNWVTGDYFICKSNTPYAEANAGLEDRYTLQITGEQYATFDNWSKLHYFNIPNLFPRIESAHEMVKSMKEKVIDKIKPFYIYCDNQTIEDLKNITHDNKTVKYLNNTGIDFYLTKPLCSYYTHRPKRSMGYYSEFRRRDDNYLGIRADELDSIAEYAARNKLRNITVYTVDYDVDKIYGKVYPKLVLTTNDINLKIAQKWSIRKDSASSENFTKKFISLNGKYTVHRHVVAAYLSQLESNISWCYKGDIKLIFYKDGWVDSEKWKTANPDQHSKFLKGVIHLNEYAPINLDYKIAAPTLVTDSLKGIARPNDQYSNLKVNLENIKKFYDDSFCDIVCESRFAQPTAMYSEQAYRPMYYKRPFVMIAPPKTLEYMKTQGFKTFDNFWDESYDDEYHHHTRILKIFDVIDYINSKSLTELIEIYRGMTDILEHNFNLLQEKAKR
jgi:hypothetical protein